MLRSELRAGAPLPRGLVLRAALVPVIALAVLWGGAPGASAAMIVPLHSTLHLSIHREHGQVYSITVSGRYAQAPVILYVFVHSGARSCAATRTAESFLVESQIQSLGENAATELFSQEVDTPNTTSGSYSVQGYWGVDAPPGVYRVCAYLMGIRAESQPCVPPHDTVPPCAPPDATGSAPLTIRTQATGLIYPITAAARRAYDSGDGSTPPPTTTFPCGTTVVDFFFRWYNAGNATRYQIIVYEPHGERDEDSGAVHDASAHGTSGWTVLPAFAHGTYRCVLMLDGQTIAATRFVVRG